VHARRLHDRQFRINETRELLLEEEWVAGALVTLFCGFCTLRTQISRSICDSFSTVLKPVAPWVYVFFFTLTGAALDVDSAVHAILLSLLLFFVRFAAIFVGTNFGGWFAGGERDFRFQLPAFLLVFLAAH
jgi:hypothetical protein